MEVIQAGLDAMSNIEYPTKAVDGTNFRLLVDGKEIDHTVKIEVRFDLDADRELVRETKE